MVWAKQVAELRAWQFKPRLVWMSILSLTLFLSGVADAAEPCAPPDQSAAGSPPTAAPAQPENPPADTEGRDTDAIRRLIEQRLEALQRSRNQQRRTPTTRPVRSATRPDLRGRRQVRPPQGPVGRQPTSAPVRPAKKGCGDKGPALDLNPPPPGQPQPRWACEQLEVTADPVWRGKKAEFVFKVRNEGEGVLNIKLKAG